MGFFGGKENDAGVDAMHHGASMDEARRFGTPLRSNVDRSRRSTQSSTKKKVKVRRTPQPTSSNNLKAFITGNIDASRTEHRMSLFPSAGIQTSAEKTVVFTPGPVGLQLEPVNDAPMYGCRVTRFVDGGPNDPGQARKSGKIKPGDLVLKVEAEGTFRAATTYNEIIDLLKLSHAKRIITVQSVWDSNPDMRETPRGQQSFIPTKRQSTSGVKNRTNETPVTQSPTFIGMKSNDAKSPSTYIENEVIFQSPFQNVLPALSAQEESLSQTSPIRNRTALVEESKGPVIVPLKSGSITSSSEDTTLESSKISVHSQRTTQSSNESTDSPPRQALADQFLLFDGVMGAFEPESSLMSSDSATSSDSDLSKSHNQRTTKDTDERQLLGSCHIRSPEKQQVDHSKQENITSVTSRSQIGQHQILFEDTLARAEFEQRLQTIRREHAKTERELKDLYIHTCERNENKIRELQVNNDVLQRTLESTKTKQDLLTNKRIKELEIQVAEAQKLRMQMQVEARERIKSKTSEYSRLVKAKEQEFMKRIADLEDEIADLRDDSTSKSIELDMARTMVKEMESRILQAETEKDEVTNRLQNASYSIQELEESILIVREGDETRNGMLVQTQRKLDELMKENEALVEEIEGYESFKEESSVLTEKLANSVQEKQKALFESQSLASKLESENDSLTKQISEAMSDVEQLLQEKLILEDKLAVTWKDIRTAKNDASTIHETLLEKLENGEYYTSADVEEKEIAIRALKNELGVMKEASKDQMIKANKKTLNVHLQLRGTERQLSETRQLKWKACKERDDLQNRGYELQDKVDDLENQLENVTEKYEIEKSDVQELTVQVELATKSKEETELYYRTSMESLSNELDVKKNELALLESRLEEVQAEKDDAVATIDELNVEMETFTKSKEEAEEEYQKSIESLSLEVESKKSELSLYECKLEEAKSTNEKQVMISINLQSQLEVLQKTKQESESAYEKSIESLSSELEVKTNELSMLENRLEEVQAEKDDAVATIDGLNAEMETFTKSKEEAEAEYQKSIESLSLEVESKLSELSSCECKLEEAKSTNEEQVLISINLQSQIESLQKTKQESESAYEKSIESLSSELEVKTNELTSFEKRLCQSESEKDDAIATGNELKDQLNALEKSRNESDKQYQKTIDELSSDIQAARSDLSSCENALEQMKCRKNAASSRLKELDRQLEAMEKSKEESELQYKKEVEAISSELEMKTNEFSVELDRFEMIEKNLEDALTSLQNKKERLVTEYEEKFDLLQSQLLSEKEQLELSKRAEKELLQKLGSLGLEREKETEQFERKIENLTSELQSQCEELSCMEMRLELLEEDNDAANTALDDAMEKIDVLELEKEKMEASFIEKLEMLTSKSQSQLAIFESSESNLKLEIEKLVSENSKAGLQHREDIKQLMDEHEITKGKLSDASATLKELEDNGVNLAAIAELKRTVEELKSENEASTTRYWEGIQELTTDLQAQTDEISRKQSILEDMEEELESNEIKIQDMEHEIFQNDNVIGDLRSEVESQTKIIASHELELSKREDHISNLQSKLAKLEKEDEDDKIELQNSITALKRSVMDSEKSKEKLSIDSCSEIFRLVKRLAILEHAHSDVKDQRLKAMEIAEMQRKWQDQTKSEVAILQKKLESTSERALELEDELNHHIAKKQEEKDVVTIELAEKTKHLEHQSMMTSTLQAEVSAMVILAKTLEDSKDRELNELKAVNEDLKLALSSEKKASSQSAGDAYDARMELKMLHKKFNSMVMSNNEELFRRENFSTMMARSLFQANAVVASLLVQLKEKDRGLSEALHDLQECKYINERQLLDLTQAGGLALEVESNLKSVAELKSRLAEAEDYAKGIRESLEVAQSSERDARSQLSKWKRSLQTILLKKKSSQSSIEPNEEVIDTGGNVQETEVNEFEISVAMAKINGLLDENSLLEESLQSAKNEKLTADELLEKSMKTVDVLHETVSELREKLASKSKDVDSLREQLAVFETSSCRLKYDLKRTEEDYQEQVKRLEHDSRNLSYDVLRLRESEETNKKRTAELREANARFDGKMEELNLTIAENERQYEELQQAMRTLENNLLSEEGKSKEVETLRKKEVKERTRLLKNIEDLSTKLISLEESQKQSEVFYKSSEEALKKSLSKIRAEFVVKHLETNDLKKQIVVLNHGAKKAKKRLAALNSTVNDLQLELENSKVALSRSESRADDLSQKNSSLEDERKQYEKEMEHTSEYKDKEIASMTERVIQANADIEKLNEEKKYFDEQHARKQRELEVSLSEKSAEFDELHQKALSLQENLRVTRERVNTEERARKSEAGKYLVLQKEADHLSSRLEILEKEKCLMSETIRRQHEQLQAEEEKFNHDIANEMTRLREEVAKLNKENFTKASSIAKLDTTLESMHSRFEILSVEKSELDQRLANANTEIDHHREMVEVLQKDLAALNNAKEALIADLEALRQKSEREKHTHVNEVRTLNEKYNSLEVINATLREFEKNAKMMELEKELKQLGDRTERSDPPVIAEDPMSVHLSSVKDAFHKQSAVLEDVKLSEKMLETLIMEVVNLASRSESEMLELSSTLGTVDDLLLNPSSLLASLDLAGLDSSECYFGEVRSRLEDLAALAYSTSVELNNRQHQLVQWKSNRSESPAIPVTPPSAKHINRALFHTNDGDSTCDITAVITDGAREVRDKVAGARLLSCVLENHSKMELASAFRKWTCATGMINASSNATNHKETAAELAHELEITREKLMVLKNHLKLGRGGKQGGKQKPRLRRILERLDGNTTDRVADENMSSSVAFQIHSDQNDCSFGI